MQTETGHLTHRVAEVIFRIAGGQRLKGKHLASRLRPHCNAVSNRVSYLFLVSGPAQRVRALLLAGGVAAPFLLIAVAANIVLSGCPLFPSSLFCQSLPWSLSPADADAYAAVIRDFHRWGWRNWTTALRDQNFAWLLGWPRVDKPAFGMLIIALIATGFAIWKPAARVRLRNALAPIMLGATGIAFVMTNAPGIRFLTGYVAILIGVALASLAIGAHRQVPRQKADAAVRLVWLSGGGDRVLGYGWRAPSHPRRQ